MIHSRPLASLPGPQNATEARGQSAVRKKHKLVPTKAKAQAGQWACGAAGAAGLDDCSSLFPCVKGDRRGSHQGFHFVRKPRQLELSTGSVGQK